MRYLALICLVPVVLYAAPASALTNKQKMQTCQFGAKDQKLTGAARKQFITRCMANEDAREKPAAPGGKQEPEE